MTDPTGSGRPDAASSRRRTAAADLDDLFGFVGAFIPASARHRAGAGRAGTSPLDGIADLISGSVGDLLADGLAMLTDTLDQAAAGDQAPRPQGTSRPAGTWSAATDDPTTGTRTAPAAAGDRAGDLDERRVAVLARLLDIDATRLREALDALEDDVAEEPTDPAARVRDHRGDVWARFGDVWLSPAGQRTWADLHAERGPLRLAT